MMTYDDYIRADLMAYRCIAALNIDKLPIDPLMILSFCKNTAVHPYSELRKQLGMNRLAFRTEVMEGRDACTATKILPDGRRIHEVFYNDEGNRFRERFTLGHELGHIILKHETGSQGEEQLANRFSSQILCPRPLVWHLRDHGFRVDADLLRNVFRVSYQAGCVAAKKTELYGDRHEEMVVRLLGDAALARAEKFLHDEKEMAV